MRRRRSFKNDGELVNLTPLLDVLFVVLVMFIIITPLIQTDNIALSKVEKNSTSAESKEFEGLKILVDQNNVIKVNGNQLSYDELKRLALKLSHQKKLQLYCDKNASFGNFQKIKMMMQEAGFNELQVVVEHE
jgi:biopolymer transport protein ExbD